LLSSCSTASDEAAPLVERNVAVPMRDGAVLRANVWRPSAHGRFPVLVYRTPYGKDAAESAYSTHLRAVARGYAVLLQDVRGRYESDGEFYPYRNEGRDGFDTIEWAASQPWSNGSVGTFGLSYPGAVQWLAAVESPPHLKAMVPAMTFSSPRRFFYNNGVWDLSWLAWIHNSIAPDTRRRKGLEGPVNGEEARSVWQRDAGRLRSFLPLAELPDIRDVAPYYYEWLRHPPEDPWWDWSEIRGRYDRVNAAVLNLSGWHDEAYGPEGASTNFQGLVAARSGASDPRTKLVMGPWVHGVGAIGSRRVGDLDFGAEAAIDYDELILRWMDRYVRDIDNGANREEPVRIFVMGVNAWRDEPTWPLSSARDTPYYLAAASVHGERGGLVSEPPSQASEPSRYQSDPARPVEDPYPDFGPHDYAALAERPDLLVFESPPLAQDTEVSGAIGAEIYLSCDCRDTDLWLKLLDVGPDGKAFNLMSPGAEVLRASLRDPNQGRQLLEPGEVYRLEFENLLTSNLFRAGHRIRLVITSTFFPHFSRNLHTGESEAVASRMQVAEIRIHHDSEHPSRLRLPVLP
jgi:putative CocE/NonD family hydrolase